LTVPLTLSLGTPGAPSFTFTGDTDTGMYSPGADQLGFSTGNTARLILTTALIQALLPFQAADGSLGSAAYGFTTGAGVDGVYRAGTNRVGIQTNSLLGFAVNANQQPESPTAFRMRVTTTAEALSSSATPSAISMDTEVTDVGSWGTAPTATWTVPTGGDGFYMITGHIRFDESTSATANVGDVRRGQLVANAVVVADEDDEPKGTTDEDVAHSLSALVQLTAGQVIGLYGAQDSGNSMDVDGHLAACRIW